MNIIKEWILILLGVREMPYSISHLATSKLV